MRTKKKELITKGIDDRIEVIWFDEQQNSLNADACFDLLFNEKKFAENIFLKDVLVFANAVISTATELPVNYVRINAWKGFFSRNVIEINASNEIVKEKASVILNALGWKFAWTSDEPGMIAARIIAMIIN